MSDSEIITIETLANDLAHRIMPECIGSCTLLSLLPEGQVEEALQAFAAENRVWCHGPVDGQKPGGLCSQPVETKNAIMQHVRKARV